MASSTAVSRPNNHRYCCVPFCKSDGTVNPDISFHRLPNDASKRKAWLHKIRRKQGPEHGFTISDGTCVCSLHFTKEDYRWTPVRKCLKSSAIPSIFKWSSAKEQSLVLEEIIPGWTKERSKIIKGLTATSKSRVGLTATEADISQTSTQSSTYVHTVNKSCSRPTSPVLVTSSSSSDKANLGKSLHQSKRKRWKLTGCGTDDFTFKAYSNPSTSQDPNVEESSRQSVDEQNIPLRDTSKIKTACIVPNCPGPEGLPNGIYCVFHRIPQRFYLQWMKAIFSSSDHWPDMHVYGNRARVCSLHFEKSCYKRTPDRQRNCEFHTNREIVPTIFNDVIKRQKQMYKARVFPIGKPASTGRTRQITRPICMVASCPTHSRRWLCVTYHQLPTEEWLAREWIRKVHGPGFHIEEEPRGFVCCLHFKGSDYSQTDRSRNFGLHQFAIPTVFDGYDRELDQPWWRSIPAQVKTEEDEEEMSMVHLQAGDLNPYLTCPLCHGYLYNATTSTECLHTFCQSCIAKHVVTSLNCPVCTTLIHPTDPRVNLKPDTTIQDLVFNIFPAVFEEEKHRELEFYRARGETAPLEDARCESVADDYLMASDSGSEGETMDDQEEDWSHAGRMSEGRFRLGSCSQDSDDSSLAVSVAPPGSDWPFEILPWYDQRISLVDAGLPKPWQYTWLDYSGPRCQGLPLGLYMKKLSGRGLAWCRVCRVQVDYSLAGLMDLLDHCSGMEHLSKLSPESISKLKGKAEDDPTYGTHARATGSLWPPSGFMGRFIGASTCDIDNDGEVYWQWDWLEREVGGRWGDRLMGQFFRKLDLSNQAWCQLCGDVVDYGIGGFSCLSEHCHHPKHFPEKEEDGSTDDTVSIVLNYAESSTAKGKFQGLVKKYLIVPEDFTVSQLKMFLSKKLMLTKLHQICVFIGKNLLQDMASMQQIVRHFGVGDVAGMNGTGQGLLELQYTILLSSEQLLNSILRPTIAKHYIT